MPPINSAQRPTVSRVPRVATIVRSPTAMLANNVSRDASCPGPALKKSGIAATKVTVSTTVMVIANHNGTLRTGRLLNAMLRKQRRSQDLHHRFQPRIVPEGRGAHDDDSIAMKRVIQRWHGF